MTTNTINKTNCSFFQVDKGGKVKFWVRKVYKRNLCGICEGGMVSFVEPGGVELPLITTDNVKELEEFFEHYCAIIQECEEKDLELFWIVRENNVTYKS